MYEGCKKSLLEIDQIFNYSKITPRDRLQPLSFYLDYEYADKMNLRWSTLLFADDIVLVYEIKVDLSRK